jgi:flavodoxin-like protein
MRSLVVYESWFGNTRRIAEKIAAALAAESRVDVVSVDEPLQSLVNYDLVVLGAPTHIHGLSSARSRKGAIDQRGDGGEVGIGARDWIDQLPPPPGDVVTRIAVFDTRAHKPELLVGSAAHGMARRVQRRGYQLALGPESFFVEGTDGPLEEGELEHAWEWGRRLANEVMSPTA